MNKNVHIAIIDPDNGFKDLIQSCISRVLNEEKVSTHVNLNLSVFSCIEKFRENIFRVPHLVFLSYLMDQVDLNKRTIRELIRRDKNCKIVVLSTQLSMGTTITPILLGADACFQKDKDLIESIEDYLRHFFKFQLWEMN